MKQVFVTGASGFLGAYIVRALVARGYGVRALARSAKAIDVVRALGAEPVKGDLSEGSSLRQALQRCDAVIHSAALFALWGPLADFEAVNVEGTRHLLAEAAAAGIKSFVQIGASGVVMGEAKDMVRITEANTSLAYPGWAPYLTTKARSEAVVLQANRSSMRTSVIRPPLIWGAGMPMLDEFAVGAEQFRWPNGGGHLMSTSHAANVAEAAVLAMERAPGGKSYFVADGQDRSLKDILTALLATRGVRLGNASMSLGVAGAMARAMEFVWSTFRLRGQPPLTRQLLRMIGYTFTLDDTLARSELGYRPVVTWEKGLTAMA